MTEEEARKKLCPFRSGIGGMGGHVNVNCCTSMCMMWQWEKGTATVNGVLQENVQLDIGYCGLAGRGE